MIQRMTFKEKDGTYNSKKSYYVICNKLAAYEDAEEQGLLLKLPCKVGDTVWFVGNKFVNDYEIRRFIIDEIGIDAIQVAKTIKGKDYWNSFNIDDFGKTVFLTQEQAEEALKKMRETE